MYVIYFNSTIFAWGLHVHTLFSYYLPIFHELTPEKLNFKEGIALGEVDIFIDGGKTETGYLRKRMYRVLSIGVSLILMLPSSGSLGRMPTVEISGEQDMNPAIGGAQI